MYADRYRLMLTLYANNSLHSVNDFAMKNRRENCTSQFFYITYICCIHGCIYV